MFVAISIDIYVRIYRHISIDINIITKGVRIDSKNLFIDLVWMVGVSQMM